MNDINQDRHNPKITYALVHGSFHGSWCWEKLIPFLADKGIDVIAPDAKGQGKEHESYVEIIGEILKKQQTPVILLGHSSGGIVISEIVKRYPEQIKALVYLSAFLLPEGVYPTAVMQHDTISLMRSSIVVDKEHHISYIKKDLAKKLFYNDCLEQLANWAISLLSPEPLVPRNVVAKETATAKISVSSIPRFYIETLNDNALGITTQRKMYNLLHCEAVYSLLAGHSPFLSLPMELSEILLQIAQHPNVRQI